MLPELNERSSEDAVPPTQRKSLKSLEKCKLLKPLAKMLIYRGFVETRKGASVHNLVRADVINHCRTFLARTGSCLLFHIYYTLITFTYRLSSCLQCKKVQYPYIFIVGNAFRVGK